MVIFFNMILLFKESIYKCSGKKRKTTKNGQSQDSGKHCAQRWDEDRQRKTQHKKLKRWETQNLQKKKEGAVPVT
jgi:hypothetical protein